MPQNAQNLCPIEIEINSLEAVTDWAYRSLKTAIEQRKLSDVEDAAKGYRSAMQFLAKLLGEELQKSWITPKSEPFDKYILQKIIGYNASQMLDAQIRKNQKPPRNVSKKYDTPDRFKNIIDDKDNAYRYQEVRRLAMRYARYGAYDLIISALDYIRQKYPATYLNPPETLERWKRNNNDFFRYFDPDPKE